MAKIGRTKSESALLKAVRFISLVQNDDGETSHKHCRFVNGTLVGFNGVLAAGVMTPEIEANFCPHTFRLVDALERAGEQFSLVVLDNGNTKISNDKWKATVPGVAPDAFQYVGPDPARYLLTDAFLEAASAAGTFTREGAVRVAYAAIWSRDGSLLGTNGGAIVEARHGLATPPNLAFPKQFFDTLAKVKKPITHFGFDEFGYSNGQAASFTVWFEDTSWLRTQLYVNETLPSVDMFLAYIETSHPTKPAKEFFEAVRAVLPFSADHRVYFLDQTVSSHAILDEGASYVMKSMVPSAPVNGKHVLELDGIANEFDFTGNERVVTFIGKKGDIQIRGVLAKNNV